ncbi:MAG: hypothetical protein ACI8PZ_003715 [Myxococcota bacterium]|jgi:hypothetical protein
MQRAMPLLVSAVIAAVAFGAALVVNTLIGAFVAPDEPVAAASADLAGMLDDGGGTAAAAASPRAKSEQVYLDGILCRNMFDPESIGSCQERLNKGKVAGGAGGALSDLPFTLVGTMVAEPSSFSVAFLRQDGQETGSYGESDKLLDATIIGIEAFRVKVRRGNNAVEYISMDSESAEKPERRATAKADDDDGGVREDGENKFVVSRDLLDKYINDIESISKMGRALLHRGPDGEFDGYRLSAIRRNTLADKLGIRNGDVVHNVNGKPLNSVQAAMEAYQTMTNDNQFSFEVTRRGQKMSLDYEVE